MIRAAEKRASLLADYGRPGADAGWTFLTGDDVNIHRVTDAVGFMYHYVEREQQYAHPTAIDADAHDRLMACVSHLPHVLANMLVAQAAEVLGQEGAERLGVVGPSFRDATRVAGANGAIWTDIYMANSDALIAAIDALEARLGELRGWLAAHDEAAVSGWNERARRERDLLLGAGLLSGQDGQSVGELRVPVPNRPGVIADIALALGRAGVNIADMALSPSPDNSRGVLALWIGGGEQRERAAELISALGFPVNSA